MRLVYSTSTQTYIIIIIYNQSNAITCLEYVTKHIVKFIFFSNKIVRMYLKNLNLLKSKNLPTLIHSLFMEHAHPSSTQRIL